MNTVSWEIFGCQESLGYFCLCVHTPCYLTKPTLTQTVTQMSPLKVVHTPWVAGCRIGDQPDHPAKIPISKQTRLSSLDFHN